ncbi:MAG TPA: zinc-dependent alcohol dehydrogenase family protein [Gemmataceae bacterium]|jgi:NADPH:quinone reductase-like Zn-dependent oxidoreductase|nr:zinc-dependent alcohol dehydrogenase family protein [Gemmataceae bacterium]
MESNEQVIQKLGPTHMTRALVFDETGDPAQVLRVKDVPLPTPGSGEVRVRMLAAPINPSDLLFIRGQYGRRPELPGTAGFEGAGVVEEAGPGLLGRMRVGRRVAVLHGRGGSWQEYAIVPSRQVVPVPRALPDEQAACFFVNPATALIMTRSVLRVPRDRWLLQSAAGSALGRMIIQLGKHYGFRTMNVVRRREQADELKALGADAVICTQDEQIEKRVMELTKGEGVPYAIDSVGGATGSALVRSLGHRGRMIVYGTLAEEPLQFDSRLLVVGQKRLEGFWLSEWTREQGTVTMLRLFKKLARLMTTGVIATNIGKSFGIDQFAEATRLAAEPGHQGKVLFRFQSSK